MRTHILDFPWEMRGAASHLGAGWDKTHKAFIYKGASLPATLTPFASEDYSWERWKEDDLNSAIKKPQEGQRMTPRPLQVVAAKKIASCAKQGYRGFLEADATGVGKTISCLLGAYGVAKVKGFTPAKPAKVLIICPKSVMPHWRNTLRNMNFTNLRVTVINYDRAKSLLSVPASAASAKKTRTKNKQIANNGKSLVQWDIIIADESHKLKNIQISQRAKAFASIARYSEKVPNVPFVIWASATIGSNPIDLGVYAPLIGQMNKVSLNLDNWGDWLIEQGFHLTKNKVGYSWIKDEGPSSRAAQKSDIKKMREMLFDTNFPSIRRHPDNVIQRIPVPISLDNADRRLYDELWNDFRSFLSLHPRGKNPQSALVQQLRFRQKASLLRVDGTVDFIADMLDNDLQVAVNIKFMESLDAVKAKLEKKGISCAEFSGRNVKERENERLRFQREEVKVILFSVTEGISLHAGETLAVGKASLTPRITVAHDLPYSSLESLQTEGRTHRDGQVANIYYMFAENTVEEKIAYTMKNRIADTKDMSGDDLDSVEEIENIFENYSLVS